MGKRSLESEVRGTITLNVDLHHGVGMDVRGVQVCLQTGLDGREERTVRQRFPNDDRRELHRETVTPLSHGEKEGEVIRGSQELTMLSTGLHPLRVIQIFHFQVRLHRLNAMQIVTSVQRPVVGGGERWEKIEISG